MGWPAMVGRAAALERARALADGGTRRILGIVGAPGAGKSTLAAKVVGELGTRAVLVPMDGFHLAQVELRRLGRSDRKGAPDTFDAAGLVVLLGRLRAQGGGQGSERAGERGTSDEAHQDVVYAPVFDRSIEEPIAAAVPVARDVPLVVVEGNYLLHDDDAWAGVAALLDESWYLEADDEVRQQRLVARHIAFGRTPEAARTWALGTDERNARLIAANRLRATVVVRVEDPGTLGA
jgi:pantothenate kinase